MPVSKLNRTIVPASSMPIILDEERCTQVPTLLISTTFFGASNLRRGINLKLYRRSSLHSSTVLPSESKTYTFPAVSEVAMYFDNPLLSFLGHVAMAVASDSSCTIACMSKLSSQALPRFATSLVCNGFFRSVSIVSLVLSTCASTSTFSTGPFASISHSGRAFRMATSAFRCHSSASSAACTAICCSRMASCHSGWASTTRKKLHSPNAKT
eukprot:scaffold85_cov358-Pavlova_lutheri.AAC.18